MRISQQLRTLERTIRLWRIVRPRAALAVPALLLAACGFTPLYGTGAPASKMSGRVVVAMLEGAPGFRLREELTGRLGPPSEPTHRLEVALDLDQTGVALTQENFTTRFNVVGTADYRLVPLTGGAPVLTGQVRAITGYSAPATETASAFATLSASRDAEQRVARDLADRILQRLALSAGEWT